MSELSGRVANQVHESVLPADPEVVGVPYNFRSRRFLWNATNISCKAIAAGAVGTITGSVDIANCTNMKNYIQFAPHAQIKECVVKIVPTRAANQVVTNISTAFVPHTDAAVANAAAVQAYPSANITQICPKFPGGAPPIAKFAIEFNWGVQSQLKPVPLYGGTPRFVFTCETAALDITKALAAQALYTVFVEIVVEI